MRAASASAARTGSRPRVGAPAEPRDEDAPSGGRRALPPGRDSQPRSGTALLPAHGRARRPRPGGTAPLSPSPSAPAERALRENP